MDLSALLAVESAHVQAKEAEALAILTALAEPAKQTIEAAEREVGTWLRRDELGMFVSPAAHEMFNKGRKDATRFLFRAYATTVFRLVPDAETFIGLLGPVGERVKSKLSVIDRHEAELCRLEWVKLAWERAEPGAIQRLWMRVQARWRQHLAKSTSGYRGTDLPNPRSNSSGPTAVDASPVQNTMAMGTGDAGDTLDRDGARDRITTEAAATGAADRVGDTVHVEMVPNVEPCAESDSNLDAEPQEPRLVLNVNLVKTWIENEGWTNQSLAQKLGISERAVSSLRNDGQYHGTDAVTKLANLMCRDPEDLYLP